MECLATRFRIAPSRRLCCALCALHLLALLGLAGTSLNAPLVFAPALLLACSLARQLHAHRELRREGGAVLELDEGQWWFTRAGARRAVRMRADTAVLSFAVVLRLQDGRRVHSLVVLGDSLGRDEMRRLRVLLRLRGAD